MPHVRVMGTRSRCLPWSRRDGEFHSHIHHYSLLWVGLWVWWVSGSGAAMGTRRRHAALCILINTHTYLSLTHTCTHTCPHTHFITLFCRTLTDRAPLPFSGLPQSPEWDQQGHDASGNPKRKCTLEATFVTFCRQSLKYNQPTY